MKMCACVFGCAARAVRVAPGRIGRTFCRSTPDVRHIRSIRRRYLGIKGVLAIQHRELNTYGTHINSKRCCMLCHIQTSTASTTIPLVNIWSAHGARPRQGVRFFFFLFCISASVSTLRERAGEQVFRIYTCATVRRWERRECISSTHTHTHARMHYRKKECLTYVHVCTCKLTPWSDSHTYTHTRTPGV